MTKSVLLFKKFIMLAALFFVIGCSHSINQKEIDSHLKNKLIECYKESEKEISLLPESTYFLENLDKELHLEEQCESKASTKIVKLVKCETLADQHTYRINSEEHQRYLVKMKTQNYGEDPILRYIKVKQQRSGCIND